MIYDKSTITNSMINVKPPIYIQHLFSHKGNWEIKILYVLCSYPYLSKPQDLINFLEVDKGNFFRAVRNLKKTMHVTCKNGEIKLASGIDVTGFEQEVSPVTPRGVASDTRQLQKVSNLTPEGVTGDTQNASKVSPVTPISGATSVAKEAAEESEVVEIVTENGQLSNMDNIYNNNIYNIYNNNIPQKSGNKGGEAPLQPPQILNSTEDEFVKLPNHPIIQITRKQAKALKSIYSQNNLSPSDIMDGLDIFQQWGEESPKKFKKKKSHYFCLRGWVMTEVMRRKKIKLELETTSNYHAKSEKMFDFKE